MEAFVTDLATKIEALLKGGVRLREIQEALVEFKESGGTQEQAIAILERARGEVGEAQEDLLLEALDLVSGFCAPDWRIWQ